MDRDTFAERFYEAATQTREFAKQFVEERLPDALRFRVLLNQSHDAGPRLDDERLYPEDSSEERATGLRCCTADRVVTELWRGGMVPEWVDLSVIGLVKKKTIIEVRCCGRFTANEARLYHEEAGLPPFHVQSPPLVRGQKDGEKYRLRGQWM